MVRTLSGESDKFSFCVLSFEPPIPRDDYVLLGRKELLFELRSPAVFQIHQRYF